jgi:hypothetical protein
MENLQQNRFAAISKFLDEYCEGEITVSKYDDCVFEYGNQEYLVLTDSEADEKAKEYIRDSVWAFRASFLAYYTDLPEEMFSGIQDKCESANDAILTCIERAPGGLDGFVSEAISADGRGHFLSQYDGDENEVGEFYIYRLN